MKSLFLLALIALQFSVTAEPSRAPKYFAPAHIKISLIQLPAFPLCEIDNQAPVFENAWVTPGPFTEMGTCGMDGSPNIQVHLSAGIYKENGENKKDYQMTVLDGDTKIILGFATATVYDVLTKKFSLEANVVVNGKSIGMVDATFDESK